MHDFYGQVNMVESEIYSDDSKEYEWDSLSEDSFHDKDIIVIHSYTNVPQGKTQDSEDLEILPIGKARIDHPWLGEPWVALWEGDLNVRFNPHVFFPVEFLGIEECLRIIYIAASLTEGEDATFMFFLQEETINFVWSYAHMPGLDPNLVVHHLLVNPNAKLVKKNLHKMYPKVALLVKVEIEKLLQENII